MSLGSGKGRSVLPRPSIRTPPLQQISRQRRETIDLALSPSIDGYVAPFQKVGLGQAPAETLHHMTKRALRPRMEKTDHGHCRLLRARSERPAGCRAAEQRYELAPPHLRPGPATTD
jgi:hypothetical protein